MPETRSPNDPASRRVSTDAGTRYQYVEACDNCGSLDWSVYGVSLARDALHPVQCRCASCGLVFANPRAPADELSRFYDAYPSRFPSADGETQWRISAQRILRELGEVSSSGRLLDVGCSTGVFLEEARAAGHDVTGVELSGEGAKIARDRGFHVVQGDLSDAGLGDESFDVVHAWHVIEHVFDLDGFVRELHRVTRPGGVVLIGTESYATAANALARLSRRARGQVPRAVTSTQHTFVFDRAVLTDVLARRGFVPLQVRAYDELPLASRIRRPAASTALRRGVFAAMTAATAVPEQLLGRGPYLRGYFRRA